MKMVMMVKLKMAVAKVMGMMMVVELQVQRKIMEVLMKIMKVMMVVLKMMAVLVVIMVIR